MSDVSSTFIVYLLELLTWQRDDYKVQQVLDDLWPHAKRAAEWHLNVSAAEGIPSGLCDTYDHLGLSGYPYDTYGAAFHLLAMRAAEILAYGMGMFLHVRACMPAVKVFSFVSENSVLRSSLYSDIESRHKCWCASIILAASLTHRCDSACYIRPLQEMKNLHNFTID